MFVLIVLTILILAMLKIFWLLMSSKSVIWSFRESGSISGEPGIVIFNPFRERKSEAEAEKFLNLLKNGDCENAILSLENPRNYEDICERESRHKLEDWKLSNRKDSEQSVKLYYRLKRASYSGYDGQMWIDVEKKTDGWKVREIEAIY